MDVFHVISTKFNLVSRLNLGFTKRYLRILLCLFVFLSLFLFFQPALGGFRISSKISVYPTTIDTPPEDHLPPLYERYTEYERFLPQHDETLPPPDGHHAKYIFFANHAYASGWGNVLQEMILNAHLAYLSGRGFVFTSYTWSQDVSSPYSTFNDKVIPARIPLSVYLSGPIVGASFTKASVPRAISQMHFAEICSVENRTVIDSSIVRAQLEPEPQGADLMQAWVKMLNSIDSRCVEIQKDSPQLFDIWLLGSTRIHSLLPSLLTSPILTQTHPSKLITRAFSKNIPHFTHSTPKPSIIHKALHFFLRPSSSLPVFTPETTTSLPILALHLRRGDFLEHCVNLANWSSTYTGLNSLPTLPDRFTVPPFDPANPDVTRSYRKEYEQHCWPDKAAVVKRVREVVGDYVRRFGWVGEKTVYGFARTRKSVIAQRANKKLAKVYMMTNGDKEWVDDVKRALSEDKWIGLDWKWESGFGNGKDGLGVSSSRDLDLGWEERPVGQALDMYVAERAEVFVGNGFSSLTGNIVLMRMVRGLDPENTRFW